MDFLSNLPVEITILIAEACDVSAKAHLARLNRRLNDLATSVLLRYSVQEEGNSAMYWAAEHGHINTLERMRSCGAGVNDSSGSRLPIVFQRLAPDPRAWRHITHGPGFLPLHVAAKFGQDATVMWLLRRGARIDSLAYGLCCCPKDLWDLAPRVMNPRVVWTPLHMAICNGNLSTAKLLISRSAPVRLPRDGISGQTDLLRTASLHNNVAAIEFLVDSGLVDVDEPDVRGFVALHYACLKLGSLPAVKKLLDSGADPNAGEDGDGQPPISLACRRGFFEAAVLLLDAGARVSTRDRRRECMMKIMLPYECFAERRSLHLSPHLSATGPQRATWEEHREEFVRRLARFETSLDGWYANQAPLVLVATDSRSLARTLQVFLDVGFDVNGTDISGRTAIYSVLDLGIFDPTVASKVELLLRYGARLDKYTDRGYCAFDRALETSRTTGDASVIDFIFHHGSVANFGVGYLDRVVAHSYDSHLFNKCRLLIGHGAVLKVSDEQLHANIRNCIDRKDLKQLTFNLDLFPDRVKPYEILEMALEHYKDAKDDEMGVIKDLLARPEFDSSEPRDAPRLLHIACKYHAKVAVAQLLLEKFGGVNNFDSDWETPLSYAVDIGCRPMVKYLLLHGADPHLAPSDQDWDAHVLKAPPGYHRLHLRSGDTQYRTPFMRAIDALHRHASTHTSCQPDASERVPRPLKFILQHMPLPPLPQDPHSLSYIHYALSWPGTLRILLENGADPNSGDHCTRPPLLHFLTLVDRLKPTKPEALRILLEFGADIHRTDGQGRSFLTMMRRCTLAMANNALIGAELENEQLGFVAGLLVKNFFITLDATSGEDCVRPRPDAVADANYHEYVDRVVDYNRKRATGFVWNKTGNRVC